jgi:DinB superfamily
MKTKFNLLLLFLCCSGMALAQAKPKAKSAAEHTTVSHEMDYLLSGVEKEFVSAADAMPEDKYNFAPTSGEFKGVRTFAQQVKHVAAVNYLIFSDMLGEKPPVEIGGENGPDSITSKTDIMKRPSCLCGHYSSERSGAHQKSLWRQTAIHACGPGCPHCRPLLRPLWANGGISPHERDHSSGQPPPAKVSVSRLADHFREAPGTPSSSSAKG